MIYLHLIRALGKTFFFACDKPLLALQVQKFVVIICFQLLVDLYSMFL